MTKDDNVLFTVENLQECFCCDKLLKKNFKDNFEIKKVCFDSRQVVENSLFFAIKGENNDGHKFIKQSIEKGAVCVVGEYIPDDVKNYIETGKIMFILVENSLQALQKLAIFHRNRLKSKVIGITGNIGKTTTREMLKTVLSGFYKTNTTVLNYNGKFGLPYIICNTPIDNEVLILEMGMSYKGEMDVLSKIAKPDIAIITKIAPAHIGNFKNIDEIVEAKAEIFNGMNKNGTIILDIDGDYYDKLADIAKHKGINNIITVGSNKNADIYYSNCIIDEELKTSYNLYIDNKNYNCQIDGIIEHNVLNSLFAFAVAKILNLDIHKSINYIKTFKIVNGRGDFENVEANGKKITIINDCYNSSPEALKSSIIYLGKLCQIRSKSRVVAIIGDMLELGENSSEYHSKIVGYLVEQNIKNVVLIGKECKVIFDKLPDYYNKLFFSKTEDFEEKILNFVQDGDILMFKASHGMHFENLINRLRKTGN